MYDQKVLPDMTGMRPDSTISLVRFDPVKEMDILRKVVRRDALLSLLAEQRRKFMSGGTLCVETVLCALLETREASLEVIDAITRWRLTLVKPEPFNVRGKNYAAAMATDVGFLATGVTPLKEAFGLEFGTGNPFALPCTPSLNVAAARDRGSGNGKADKGKHGGKVAADGTTKDVTAGRAAPGGKVAPGRTRVRDTAADGTKAGGGSDTPADEPPAASAQTAAAGGEKQPGVEGSGSALTEDHVAPVEVDISPRCPKEEGRGRLKGSDQDGGGLGGGSDGGSASVHEVLRRLGDMDDEQRARLASAQRFLEEEVARTHGKWREEVWWGFHRWTMRPWIPSEHLPP